MLLNVIIAYIQRQGVTTRYFLKLVKNYTKDSGTHIEY